MIKQYILTVFSCLISTQFAFADSATMQLIPSAIVVGKNEPASINIRINTSSVLEESELDFCLEINSQCFTLNSDKTRFKIKLKATFEKGKNASLDYEDITFSKDLLRLLADLIQDKKQGENAELVIHARDKSGNYILSSPFYIYPALIKNKELKVRNADSSFSQKKERRKKLKISDKKIKTKNIKLASSDSFEYKSPPGAPIDQCSGTNNVFNSYKAFFNCTDAAIRECTQSDSFDKAFCIYERCGNLPDLFDGLWRDIDGGQSDFGGQTFIKNGAGSSVASDSKFQIQLHPCLLDGAALVNNSFTAAAVLMNKSYNLMSSFYEVFHPARPENLNLSRGRIRLSFNDKTVAALNTTNFGETTVPFTYYQELFKSLDRTAETQDQIFWINNVIPVFMYFRPQGILGIELQTRVSPVSRILEVNYSSYVDFGTASGAGPARDQVQKINNSGIVSLIQSEIRSLKYLSLSADDLGIRPSISDLVELEYWPPRGKFAPICAQWFADGSTNPNRKAYQCATLVDFGSLESRIGVIKTIRDGTERLIEYRDPQNEEEEGPPGENAPAESELPDNRYFPYRSPILDDF